MSRLPTRRRDVGVQAALAGLPTPDRELYLAFAAGGVPLDQLAADRGISLELLRRRLFAIRRRLAIADLESP